MPPQQVVSLALGCSSPRSPTRAPSQRSLAIWQSVLCFPSPGVHGPRLPLCLLVLSGKADLGGRNFPGIEKGPFSILGGMGCPSVP